MKKIISALLSAALISALYVPVSFAGETMSIYVDVKNGDDSAGNGKIDFEVTIPVGSTAKLSLPGSTAEIKKGSKLATDMKAEGGKVSFTLPQGTYEITTK